MDEKLQRQVNKLDAVLKTLETESDYVTQKELEEVIAVVVSAIEASAKQAQNKMDAWKKEDKQEDADEYKKWMLTLQTLKDSLEAQIGGTLSMNEVKNEIEVALSKVEWKKGDKGDPGEAIQGEPGKDGSPDTPEQVVEKVNSGKTLIKKERVEGLLDLMRNVAAQAVGAVGVTTTFFFKNGTQVGRAKNINIIEGNNIAASVYQTGDQMNISLSVTGGVSGLTWVSDEVPSGSGTSFTIANTPASGTFKLYRGGAKQQGGGVDFTLTGTSLTLTNALIAGEVLLCDYGY